MFKSQALLPIDEVRFCEVSAGPLPQSQLRPADDQLGGIRNKATATDYHPSKCRYAGTLK